MDIKLSDKLELSFSFGDLVNELDVEQKHELVDALACDEEIIAAVVELLVDDCVSSIWRPSFETLERERLRVLEKLDEIAFEAIHCVIHGRETARANEKRGRDWGRELHRAWPHEHRQACPKIPEWVTGEYWDRERVLQELASTKAAVAAGS